MQTKSLRPSLIGALVFWAGSRYWPFSFPRLLISSFSWRRYDGHGGRVLTGEVAMLERFTDKSCAIVVQAQHEARKMGHNFVGTEQLLLGMMAAGENQAAAALSGLAINLDDARREVEQIIGLGSGFVDDDIPFTPRAKRVFELALREAGQLGDERIEPKHLLIGIMREGDGVAAAVVRKLANSTDDIIQNFYRSFGEY